MCIHKSIFPAYQLENENMQLLMREPMWAMGRERGGNFHCHCSWDSPCSRPWLRIIEWLCWSISKHFLPWQSHLRWWYVSEPLTKCLTSCVLYWSLQSLPRHIGICPWVHTCAFRASSTLLPWGWCFPVCCCTLVCWLLKPPGAGSSQAHSLLAGMCCTVSAYSKHPLPFGFVLRALFSSQRQISVWPSDCPGWLFSFSICGFHTFAVVLTTPSSCTRTPRVDLFLCKMHWLGTVGLEVPLLWCFCPNSFYWERWLDSGT